MISHPTSNPAPSPITAIRSPESLKSRRRKPLATQRDLALAYSPGVAAACHAIAGDPHEAASLTVRQNLVAVLSNGTAVLGLGAIGPLAAKPVMEGKAVLFKKFAGIDVFDIEVAETDVDKLVDIVAALEPTFGGINLEDIKASGMFRGRGDGEGRMSIPVFHDDQHGTAIIVSAAIVNALELAGKKIGEVKIVCSGAGAAAIASLNLLVSLGARRDNIIVCDIEGVVYKGRDKLMDRWKAVYARDTSARTLADAIAGADIFLGLSAGGVLKPEMLKQMASDPLVMALANPTPEIMPELALETRPDAMICTGRSDYPEPGQQRPLLSLHFSRRSRCRRERDQRSDEESRGRGDCGAGARDALRGRGASLWRPVRAVRQDFAHPEPVRSAADAAHRAGGRRAAMESGVAARPIADFDAYADQLNRFVFRSGFIMKPLFAKARAAMKTVIYSEGEDERVLRATQVVLEERLAKPILIGRPDVIRDRIKRFGLTIKAGDDFELIDPEDDPRYRDYVATYLEAAGPQGRNAGCRAHRRPHLAERDWRARGAARRSRCADLRARRPLHIAPRPYSRHRRARAGVEGFLGSVAGHRLQGVYFLADTHVRYDPSAEEIAETAVACAAACAPLRPRAEDRADLAFRLRLRRHAVGAEDARGSRLLRERAPDLEVDGEMQADTALSLVAARARDQPNSRLEGEANVLIFPNLDAGSTALQMTRSSPTRCRSGRFSSARQARARADAHRDGARHRQHDGDCSCRSAGRTRAGASPRCAITDATPTLGCARPPLRRAAQWCAMPCARSCARNAAYPSLTA